MVTLPLAAALAIGQGGGWGLPEVVRPAQQETATQDRSQPVVLDDVEVFGRRGAALTPPEIEFDGADIDALGVWDIGDVLKRIQETLGGNDQPLVLINGKLTPNPGVFSGFPPDALVRAEVLPPNAGALYGAAPGQRVVNLVLQRRFSSHDGRLVGSRPTQGGTSSLLGDLRRSGIADQNTHQIGLSLSRETALRAGERDQYLVGTGPEFSAITLRPASDAVSASVNLTRAIGDWSGVFSLNGQMQEGRSVVRLADQTIESRSTGETVTASAGLSGTLVGWALQTNLNGRASRAREVGLEGRKSETQSLGLTSGLRRTLLELPSGPLIANLNTNLLTSWSLAERDHGSMRNSFNMGDVRGALAIPLAQRGEAFTGRLLGDLSASVGAGVRGGDGGKGDTLDAGLSWAPRVGVRLNADWSRASDSVSDLQRFEPQYYGAPLVIFDFQTGEAVEILPIRGGNPDLRPPQSERLGVTASVGPFTPWGVSGSLGYQRTEFSDGIGTLPALTRDVEEAFPDRVQRAPDGRIISIDYRPLNLGSTLTETVNTGLSFNLPRPSGVAAREATVLRVALNHSYQLRNDVTLLAGLPRLDRLQGDGGGVSRQGARILVDSRRGRWGANLSARWQAGSRTRRFSGQDGADDLMSSSLTMVDFRVSFQMVSPPVRSGGGRGDPAHRNGTGLQLTLDLENMFDARREARLGDGRAAPGYGRDAQDPMGRTIRLTLQRRF
jgi:hypothetical protein